MTTVRWAFALGGLVVLALATSAVLAEKKAPPEPTDDHIWYTESEQLAKTDFFAVVGSWGAKSPVQYSVAVHERTADGTDSVRFDLKLNLTGLPKGFNRKPIKEIVRFDPELRLVTFDLGDGQEARYKLPLR